MAEIKTETTTGTTTETTTGTTTGTTTRKFEIGNTNNGTNNNTFIIPSYRELRDHTLRFYHRLSIKFNGDVKKTILDEFDNIKNCGILPMKHYIISFDASSYKRLPLSMKKNVLSKLSNNDWQFEYKLEGPFNREEIHMTVKE